MIGNRVGLQNKPDLFTNKSYSLLQIHDSKQTVPRLKVGQSMTCNNRMSTKIKFSSPEILLVITRAAETKSHNVVKAKKYP